MRSGEDLSRRALARPSSRARGLYLYVNGKPQPTEVTQDGLSATIRTEKPLHLGRRNPSAIFQGALDDVRIYRRALSAAEVATLAGANPVTPILALPLEQRTKQQTDVIRQYYLQQHDAEYRRLGRELVRLRSLEASVRASAEKTTVMIMREMKTPRQTFVLQRGQYDQHGEQVSPGVPGFLSASIGESKSRASGGDPANGLRIRPPNRLGLARWIMKPDHPLTARVAANRMWQAVFGRGIVLTSEDFGTQGALPSHPQLLDWLATEYVRVGWDRKRMVAAIVTSSTYGQSSRISARWRERDPENRLLARGPRTRLPAEIIRDNALAVSGLLVERLGGPSVKPYQPAGLWKETSNRGYKQDHGEHLYRRSLYTYWKRSVPPPNMFAIDAPTRETCIVRRQRTNTPMMALVMLNDPTFVEAARTLAERVMIEAKNVPRARLARMFELATARPCRPQETDVLLKVYERQLGVYARNHDAAGRLLSTGESKRDESLNLVEHAALTTVASVILNLDETMTKE